MRSYMDCLVNSIARDIILYTFPLMLCVEGPLDFVKDCTAIFFLTTLDDTGPEKPRTLSQMLARLKFNIFYEYQMSREKQEHKITVKFSDHWDAEFQNAASQLGRNGVVCQDRQGRDLGLITNDGGRYGLRQVPDSNVFPLVLIKDTDKKFPKGIPLRFTYEEHAAAENAEHACDQFESQRDWTFTRYRDGELEPENGLNYLRENLEFMYWTRKGVDELGSFISEGLDEHGHDDDPIKKLGKFIREHSRVAKGDEPMTLKKLGKFINDGLKDKGDDDGVDPIEVDSVLAVAELQVLSARLNMLSKPEGKSDIDDRKATNLKLRPLIKRLAKNGKSVVEGGIDLDDIAEAMLTCSFVRDGNFDELAYSDLEDSSDSDESSDADDLEMGMSSPSHGSS